MTSDTPSLFRLDRDGTAADLRGSQSDLWPVNVHSDADELNQLLEATQSAGLLIASTKGACL